MYRPSHFLAEKIHLFSGLDSDESAANGDIFADRFRLHKGGFALFNRRPLQQFLGLLI
jgi:hypothetical protein